MQFFRIVGVSLLCLINFPTSMKSIDYSYYTSLLRSPQVTVAHITTTCILGALFFITYRQLQKLKNRVITKTNAQNFVSHDYLEQNLTESLVTVIASKCHGALGRYFATKGEMLQVEGNIANHNQELTTLTQKIQMLEQENNNFKQQLQSLSQRLTTLSKSEKTT